MSVSRQVGVTRRARRGAFGETYTRLADEGELPNRTARRAQARQVTRHNQGVRIRLNTGTAAWVTRENRRRQARAVMARQGTRHPGADLEAP